MYLDLIYYSKFIICLSDYFNQRFSDLIPKSVRFWTLLIEESGPTPAEW